MDTYWQYMTLFLGFAASSRSRGNGKAPDGGAETGLIRFASARDRGGDT